MKKLIILAVFAASIGYIVYAASAGAQTTNNSAPQWTQVSSFTVRPSQMVRIPVSASDPNGDSLTYSSVRLPEGSYFGPRTRVFTWIPDTNQLGNHLVTLRASDGLLNSDMSFTITVSENYNAPNTSSPYNPYSPSGSTGSPTAGGAPLFPNWNPPATAREGQLYTYTVQAVSGNIYPITYRLVTAPPGMTINGSVGVIIWIPNFSQGRPEPYNVTVGASNVQYESSRTFTIIVEDVSQTASPTPTPPVAQPTPTPPVVVQQPPTYVQPPTTPRRPRAPALAISDIRVEKIEDAVVISWETNKPARSRVIYDLESQPDQTNNQYNYENATPDPDPEDQANFKTEHSIRLEDLKGGKTYYFRAVSKTNGEMAISDEMTFETEARGLGLALLSSFGDFLSNPWLYVLIAFLIALAIYRGRKEKAATE